jgi:hypothetical protein
MLGLQFILTKSYLPYFSKDKYRFDIEMNGRSRLNFSEWNRPQLVVGEITGIIQEGEMPPAVYYHCTHLPNYPMPRNSSWSQD